MPLLPVGMVAGPSQRPGFSRAALWPRPSTTTLGLEQEAELEGRTRSGLCPSFPLSPLNDGGWLCWWCALCLTLLWKAPSLLLWMLLNKTDLLLSLNDICQYEGGLKQGRKAPKCLQILIPAGGSSGRLQTASCVSLGHSVPCCIPEHTPAWGLWRITQCQLGWATCNQEKADLLLPCPHLPATLGSLGRAAAQSRAWGKRREKNTALSPAPAQQHEVCPRLGKGTVKSSPPSSRSSKLS